MDKYFVCLGVFVIIAFVIFIWEFFKLFLIDLYFHFHKQTIEDIKENIIHCLDDADELGYEIMFRTPECVAYKKCNLHIAKTENDKEVIMVDLI
jgi:hypothetical protein